MLEADLSKLMGSLQRRRTTSLVELLLIAFCLAKASQARAESSPADSGAGQVKAATSSRARAAIMPGSVETKTDCPTGAAPDSKRSEELLARLRRSRMCKTLLAHIPSSLTICYGEVQEGIVLENGVLVLQRDRSPPANAARLGHLLHHLVEGLPFDSALARTSPRSCKELSDSADRAERQAHLLENQLRKALDLPPLPFESLALEYETRCQTLRRPQPDPSARGSM